jgi:hypothetical protein
VYRGKTRSSFKVKLQTPRTARKKRNKKQRGSDMNKKQKRYIQAIHKRITTLSVRIEAGTCKKLDEEKHELAALLWALEILQRLFQ